VICLGGDWSCALDCSQLWDASETNCDDQWWGVDHTEWIDCRYDCESEAWDCYGSCL
jgi:hypothetical protein